MKKESNKQLLSGPISLCGTRWCGIVVLLSLLFSFSARAQEKLPLVSLSVKQKTVVEIVKLLELQVSYTFVYHDLDLQKLGKKDVDVKNVPFTRVLDECLKGSDMTYSVLKDKVLFKRKPANPMDNFRKVTGVVLDETGVPIPGATVKVEGTTLGRVTNKDGNFTLMVPKNKEHVLEVSFIGYLLQKVKLLAEENTPLKVVLKEVATEIDEVVITGYQKIDRKLSAASTYTVKMEDVMEAGRTTVDQMLQGAIPGLMVVNTSGSSSSIPKMRMRGTSTLMGNAAPVWVIDGVIREDPVRIGNEDVMAAIDQAQGVDFYNRSDYESFSMLGNAISGVNPMDIESITFLKDAAATAIYGTRAANGVIVVTTKKGKSGKIRVSYSADADFKQRPSYKRSLNVMNSKERIQLAKESMESGMLFGTEPAFGYEKKMLDYMRGLVSFEEVQKEYAMRETANTDWFDLLFRNSVSQNHSLSLSGGNDKSTFYFSASFSDDKGTAKEDNTKRYTVTSRATASVFSWLDADMKLGYSVRKVDAYNGINVMSYASTMSRAIMADERYIRTVRKSLVGEVNDASITLQNDLTYNILDDIKHTSSTSTSKTLDVSVRLNAKIFSGLKAEGLFAYSENWAVKEKYAGEKSWYMTDKRGYDYGTYPMGSVETKFSPFPYGGYYTYDAPVSSKWEMRYALDYNKIFKEDHVLSLMAGLQLSSSKKGGFSTTEYGYFPERGKGIAYEYNQENSGSLSTYYGNSKTKHRAQMTDGIDNSQKFYGSLVYGYKNKYVMNSSFSLNSSNRFGENKKFRTQPVWSISGRWNVAEESWLEGQKTINQLSLKMSYGSQGNVVTSLSPDLLARYGSTPVDNIAGEYVVALQSLPNPELDWERTHTFNLGLEASVFSDRLGLTAEYYRKKTTDAFFLIAVPMEYGEEKLTVNNANVENEGVEIALRVTPVVTRNVRWTITTNVSKAKNSVKRKMKNDVYRHYITGSVTRSDYPVGSFWSNKFTGLDHRGVPTFDFGDGKYTDLQMRDDASLVLDYSGTSNPDLTGGISTALRIYGFSFSVNFAFNLGNHIRLRSVYGTMSNLKVENNYDKDLNNRWRNPGDEMNTNMPGLLPATAINAYYQTYFPDAPTIVKSANYFDMWDNSDIRVVSGNFLRCRSIGMSYDFPVKKLKNMGITGLSLGFTGKDLFVLASKKLNKQDPESSPTAVPKLPSYNLSVNLSF